MVEVTHVRRSFSEGGLSKRAEQVLAWCHSSDLSAGALAKAESWNPVFSWIPGQARDDKILRLHQATLAQQLGCSRWTIGRAIKKLKEAGLLVETGRDKQSRCKMYRTVISGSDPGARLDPGSVAGVTEPTPQGLVQLQNYRRTFELNFIHWPDWEKHYAAVTWELKDVHCIHKLFRQTFDRLYEIRDKDLQAHLTQTNDKPPVYFSQSKSAGGLRSSSAA